MAFTIIPCTFIFCIQLYPIPLYFVTMASMMLSTSLYFKKAIKENKDNTSTYAVYNERNNIRAAARPTPHSPWPPSTPGPSCVPFAASGVGTSWAIGDHGGGGTANGFTGAAGSSGETCADAGWVRAAPPEPATGPGSDGGGPDGKGLPAPTAMGESLDVPGSSGAGGAGGGDANTPTGGMGVVSAGAGTGDGTHGTGSAGGEGAGRGSTADTGTVDPVDGAVGMARRTAGGGVATWASVGSGVATGCGEDGATGGEGGLGRINGVDDPD